jgi:hypothetical protein
LLIKVTQKHINNGIKELCSQCPVALALKDAIPEAIIVKAFEYRLVYLTKNKVCYQAPSPNSVRDFINRFDASLSVEPFEFEVEFAC